MKHSIPALEHVVSEELINPISLVIWNKTYDLFLDDNVKSELHKSSSGYIVVPSVVYALYLLANVYSSLGDKNAYEGTMKRFEKVCEHLGDDSPMSNVLFTYAYHLHHHHHHLCLQHHDHHHHFLLNHHDHHCHPHHHLLLHLHPREIPSNKDIELD